MMLVKIHSFVANYSGATHYSLKKSAANQPLGRYNHHLISKEAYLTNQEHFKKQAYLRVQSPSIYNISLNADGSIDFTPKEDADKEINWVPLEMSMKSRVSNHTNADEIAYDMDYIASEYVQYKIRIEHLYTGKEREEALARLNRIIDQQIENYAEGFSSTMTSFFTSHGVEISESDIKHSVIDMFQQRITAYESFVDANPDFANIKETEEAWLLQDNIYMGDALRFSFSNEFPEMELESEYGYSIADLMATGMLITSIHHVGIDPLRNKVGRSEEEVGIELGMMAMKFELIKEHFPMGDDFKDRLEQVFTNYMKQRNQAESDYIIRQRQDPFVRNKNRYAVDWDEKYVYSLIEQIKSSLTSNNVGATLYKNLATTYELYKQKVEENSIDGLSRYHDLKQTWNPDVFLEKWNIEQYIKDWNQFIAQFPVENEADHYLINGTNLAIDVKV